MKIEDLINVGTLQGAGFEQVREVHISQGEDYDGDESYFIWLLLDDELTDEELELKPLAPLREWVQSAAWQFGNEKIIPYINIRRQKEWPVAVAEEDY